MTGNPDRWRCAVCGELFVVPTLARLCEQRHERERETTE